MSVLNVARSSISLRAPRLAWVLPVLLTACTINRYQPSHFQFVTVVEKTGTGPGGWRAACIHATVINTATLDPFVCKFGVAMPIETEQSGPLSVALAQRISADCANEAVRIAVESPISPNPGLVCGQFRTTFDKVLKQAVRGSNVTTLCDQKTTPLRVDF